MGAAPVVFPEGCPYGRCIMRSVSGDGLHPGEYVGWVAGFGLLLHVCHLAVGEWVVVGLLGRLFPCGPRR